MDALLLLSALCVVQATPIERPTDATVHSVNFVVTAPSRELAEAVLQRAEQLRESLATNWLGEPLPPSVGQSIIRVKLSDVEDRGLAWVADTPARLSHIVWLTTSRERALGGTLAHELTHVVLATRYPGQLPSWANEGAAAPADDQDRQDARHSLLQWYVTTGNWPALSNILLAESIPATDTSKYAVAASLTQFLLDRQNDRPKMLEFARAGRTSGWDAALRKFYGIRSVDELETAWRAWVTQRINAGQVAGS